MIYVLTSNDNYLNEQGSVHRTLMFYKVKEEGTFEQLPTMLPMTMLGLNELEGVEIQMAEANGVLVVTDGLKMVGVRVENPSEYWQIPVTSEVNSTGTST